MRNGAIRAAIAAAGASTPWYLTRCARGGGIRAAKTMRARRLAARRAALDTLEHYGIIKQTRGSDE